MADPMSDSKIVRPYVQSLLHLASVRVAIVLCNDLDLAELHEAIIDIRNEFSDDPLENNSEITYSKARENILFVPTRLRRTVVDASLSMKFAAYSWRSLVSNISNLEDKDCTFHWRSDGSIDGYKTAQHLVLNKSFDIRERFYLACRYCLEQDIQTLWKEMQASGETSNLGTNYNSMARFWVRRMRKESRVPWRQAIRAFFNNPQNCHKGPRYSSFFPSLRPEKRKRFINSLDWLDVDDYRLCLYAMTEEEEKEVMNKDPLKLLRAYFDGPMQNFFLQTVEKMWNYIREIDFHSLLNELFFFRMEKGCILGTDYYQFFEEFWEISPISLREIARKIPDISEKIDSCFDELRIKRKAEFDALRSLKKQKIETEMEI